MSRVALGAVGYLNARPLVYGLDRHPDFDVRFDVPSRCAALLHGGAIDLGLIPSIEYLRGDRLRIVPDLAIASRGAVASVAIFTTREMRDVRSIALDTSSRTSVALVSVLCHRVFGIAPATIPAAPDLDAMLASADAALIIGDIALFLNGSALTAQGSGPMAQASGGRTQAPARAVTKIDLGDVWLRHTGLPFVYAFWAGREGALDTGQISALQAARDAGVAAPDEIASAYYPDSPARQRVAAAYLRDNIKYRLGADERAGLELFYRYAAEAGVVETAQPLNFF